MAKIALKGCRIQDSVRAGHINYTYSSWNSCKYYDTYGNCVGGYDNNSGTTSATIQGTCNSSVTNVVIEGKYPVVNGDSTTESDSYSIPSGGSYSSGAHSSATGSVTSGNGSNVFINGKSVSVNGSTVTTHASNATTISTVGISSSVSIGA